MFQATFNPYKPSVIEWPKLDPAAHARLLSLPIWDIAVQTEGKAGLRMKTYAAKLADEDMRAAIGLNAWEEGRHKEVLSHLVAAYGIEMAPEPEYVAPRDAEWAYLVTGFSECIDSFFAFGLFEVARRSGFFPPELVETFEPVMQEECRHILLFANWLAWHRRRSAGGNGPGSSCGSRPCGRFWSGSGSGWRGGWAAGAMPDRRTTTSPSAARRRWAMAA